MLEVVPGGRADDVPSPCINVCRMNDAIGLCEGCFRTLDEIACWSGYTREEKLAVCAKLDARKRPVR
ncbi:MAG TPA: DUF1289 domain-containing protein [Burkholderiales bacterium]|nr:DUF1289 domain-containing protein [Burkholderiales bacterium]